MGAAQTTPDVGARPHGSQATLRLRRWITAAVRQRNQGTARGEGVSPRGRPGRREPISAFPYAPLRPHLLPPCEAASGRRVLGRGPRNNHAPHLLEGERLLPERRQT